MVPLTKIKTVFALTAVLLLVIAAVLAGRSIFSRTPAVAGVSPSSDDSTQLADSIDRRCRDQTTGERNPCIERELLALVDSRNVGTAMAALNRLAQQDASVQVNGHVFAHAIGIKAGTSGGAIGPAFATCTDLFQSGCHHGVIQGYFESVRAVDSASVNALCRSGGFPSDDQWLLFQCVHGMGHGLTMFYDHDLPRALHACDLLGTGWDRESCYGGAFMENIVNATSPHHPASRLAGDHHHHASTDAGFKALDPADPHYPCSIVGSRYLAACYFLQTSAMLHQNGGDVAATARSCAEAPAHVRHMCFRSLGRDITALAQQERGKAARLCALVDPAYQPWCHAGVATRIDLTAQVGEALQYCRSIKGEANQLKCYEAIGEQLGSLKGSPEERAAECAVIGPGELRQACQYGARVTVIKPAGLP